MTVCSSRSERVRRMFLIQVTSADDKPKEDLHKSPCNGLVLRGTNKNQDGNLSKRHESVSEKDANF